MTPEEEFEGSLKSAEQEFEANSGDPDFSDVQSGASSAATPNTVQQPSSGLAGGFGGAVSKFPYGPQIAAKIASMAGNRDVSLQEMQQYLANQKAATPTSFGRGEIAGKVAPSLMAAAATGGMSIPSQVAAQGAVGAGQELTAGGDIKNAALEGGKQAAFTLGGMGLAKGIGAGASALGDLAQPVLRKIANAAILKQAGYIGHDIANLAERSGQGAIDKTANILSPEIRPTVSKTAQNLRAVVNDAEASRSEALKALDKSISSDPGMPTVGDTVYWAKKRLEKAVADNPSLADHAASVSKTLDKYVDQWGADSKSFAQLDAMRRQLADLGKFDSATPGALSQLYRATSGVVRKDIDSSAYALAPGDEAKQFLQSKGILKNFIDPSEQATYRANMLAGHSTTGMLGAHGLSAGASLASGGNPLAAAAAMGLGMAQKPLRQVANYGLAKGAGAAANALEGGTGSSVGGLMSSTPASLSTGTAAALYSKRLYPDQVGQLAEKLGSPQAPVVKRAAETSQDNGQTVHNYLMNSDGQYAQTMKSAGTSTDRRQP